MKIFIDESGDLGWTLDKPNRNGGSSRYITLTDLVISENDEKYITRFISDIYKKYKLTPNIEKKGANFLPEHSSFISNQLSKLSTKCHSFMIISLTVNKSKVFDALKKDKNIFYNYALGLLLKNEIVKHERVEIILDKRTIKVSHGESFPDYIKTQVWGEGHNIEISCCFLESTHNKMLWFADWYANFVWRNYEDNENSSYSVIQNATYFSEKRLYF
jgi:Protein of unknown function (DUF3800)